MPLWVIWLRRNKERHQREAVSLKGRGHLRALGEPDRFLRKEVVQPEGLEGT